MMCFSHKTFFLFAEFKEGDRSSDYYFFIFYFYMYLVIAAFYTLTDKVLGIFAISLPSVCLSVDESLLAQ